MFAHALDRGDLLAFTTGRKQGAGQHRDAIHQHRAGAAGRIVAAALGAGKIEILTQDVEQQLARLDGQLVRATVDAKFDEFFFHCLFWF